MGALVILGSERVVKRFSEDLYHKDVERQRLAATALGLIGDISVVDTLAPTSSSPFPRRAGWMVSSSASATS